MRLRPFPMLIRARRAKQWATKLGLEVGKEKVHKVVEMCSPPDLITFTLPLTPQGPFKARNGLVSVWRPLQRLTWGSAGSHLHTQRHPGTSSALEEADEQGDSAQLLLSCCAPDNSTWIFFRRSPHALAFTLQPLPKNVHCMNFA